MNTVRDKPSCCTNAMLRYLDGLRDSGETNMLGAGAYVAAHFCLEKKEATEVVMYWFQTKKENHDAS